MNGCIFSKGELPGIDFQDAPRYAWRMNRETKTGKATKRKPKRSPKKAAVKETDEFRDGKENPKEFSEALAYFAKYFDQI